MTNCYVAQSDRGGVASRYYVTLKDHSGLVVATFDSWEKLEFNKVINDQHSYSISFVDNGDPRYLMFDVDYQVEVHRSVPAAGLDWYKEFEGLHRISRWETGSNGKKTFTSTGVGYSDLLARTIIAYDAGTVNSDKNGPSETVMKEYVDENCGMNAPLGEFIAGKTVGRLNDGILPGFTVDSDGGLGAVWEGSRPYDNLLVVLQDIARFSNVDFEVVGNGEAKFLFKTHVAQIGVNRTSYNIDPLTGKNAYGYAPVVFAAEYGNVQDMKYEIDRSKEVTVAIILGKGDYSTRASITRRDESRIDDSPWNRREVSRNGASQETEAQLEAIGDEILQDGYIEEKFSLDPLSQSSCLYGKSYTLGDRLTVKYGDVNKNQRLTAVKIVVGDGKESISHTFATVA